MFSKKWVCVLLAVLMAAAVMLSACDKSGGFIGASSSEPETSLPESSGQGGSSGLEESSAAPENSSQPDTPDVSGTSSSGINMKPVHDPKVPGGTTTPDPLPSTPALVVYPDANAAAYKSHTDVEVIDFAKLGITSNIIGEDTRDSVRFAASCDNVTLSFETGVWEASVDAFCFTSEVYSIQMKKGQVYELLCYLPEGAPDMRLVARRGKDVAIWYVSPDRKGDGKLVIPIERWQAGILDEDTNIMKLVEGYAASLYMEENEGLKDKSESFWRAVAYALTAYDVYDYEASVPASDPWVMYPWMVEACASALQNKGSWPAGCKDRLYYDSSRFAYIMWPTYYFNWIALDIYSITGDGSGNYKVIVHIGDCVDGSHNWYYQILLEENSGFDSNTPFDFHITGYELPKG